MIKIGDTFSHKSDAGYVMSHVEVIALSDKYMTLKKSSGEVYRRKIHEIFVRLPIMKNSKYMETYYKDWLQVNNTILV